MEPDNTGTIEEIEEAYRVWRVQVREHAEADIKREKHLIETRNVSDIEISAYGSTSITSALPWRAIHTSCSRSYGKRTAKWGVSVGNS